MINVWGILNKYYNSKLYFDFSIKNLNVGDSIGAGIVAELVKDSESSNDETLNNYESFQEQKGEEIIKQGKITSFINKCYTSDETKF